MQILSRKTTPFNETLILISVNLLAFYHECRSLIGYATRHLFCGRSVVSSVAVCLLSTKQTKYRPFLGVLEVSVKKKFRKRFERLVDLYSTVRLFALDFYA